MSKLTRAQAQAHNAAEALLATDRPLTHDEKITILSDWREDAQHVNSNAGAFFTPWSLALDFALDALDGSNRQVRILDLCAGIGTLSLACQARHWWDEYNGAPPLDITCVELNPDYVRVGRRILPEARWIEASIFDLPPDLGHFDIAISNPPFGKIKRDGNAPRYNGGDFEYHVIDVAAHHATRGAFILPARSAGFVYSGKDRYAEDPSSKLDVFTRQTGITLHPGIGIDTSHPGYGTWHGVNPQVEVVTCDFEPPLAALLGGAA